MSLTSFFPNNLYAQSYSANYCYYHLGNGFYIFLIKAEFEREFCKPFKEQDQLFGSLTWHTLMLYQQHIDIYPESRGLFLPHRLGLHQTQYISFDKGCYKGQEIIARTHYKATIKHELKSYVIHCEEQLQSGQIIFKVDDNTELGELVDYSPLGNNDYLVVLSILKSGAESIRLDNVIYPLH